MDPADPALAAWVRQETVAALSDDAEPGAVAVLQRRAGALVCAVGSGARAPAAVVPGARLADTAAPADTVRLRAQLGV